MSPAAPLPERSASFVLSAVSGFVDTAGFILLSGIFTAHVTGNLVLAGAAMAGQQWSGGVWTRLALMPVFMLGIVGASLLAQRGGAHSVRRALMMEAFALLGFLVIGVAMDAPGTPFSAQALFIIATPAVMAMGIQNALMRDALKNFLPTTMMTGNTTQFTLDLLANFKAPNAEARARLSRFGNVLAGFVSGAALGALGAATLRFWSVALPLVAIILLSRLAREPQP